MKQLTPEEMDNFLKIPVKKLTTVENNETKLNFDMVKNELSKEQ